jgi:dihydrofolate synthase/folylpolyglutamate synthase
MKFSRLDDWLAWLESLHPSAIELGLERVNRVATGLAISLPASVVTVAGTNGKGSCIATMEAILLAQGHRVAAYTSPHLLAFNERIRVNGSVVDDNTLCQAFERIEQARGETSLTYFEFTTLAALLVFQQAELDVVLLEVGLGGRLDAVNIIDPDIAVVTSIAIDHVEWLGNNRESIAAEKAGIFRKNTPVVCGDPRPPAVLHKRASEMDCPWYGVGQDFVFQSNGDSWQWQGNNAAGETIAYRQLPVPSVPLVNAATALQALNCLDLPLETGAVMEGIQGIMLAGRFQQVYAGGKQLILDVAHNPAAACYLATQLEAQPVKGKTRAVFAVLADKDVEGMVEAVEKQVDGWLCADLPGVNRALTGEAAAGIIADRGLPVEGFFADVGQAIDGAIRQSGAEDRVLVFGSFYTIAAALPIVGQSDRLRSEA